MLPIDPQREAVGRTIAAMLMGEEIRRGGQLHIETILTETRRARRLCGTDVDPQVHHRAATARPQRDPGRGRHQERRKIYFSDSLNWILFENLAQPPYSIWAYVLDVVPQQSRALMPDMADIVSHAARTIGTSRFGIPRMSAEHTPHKMPRAALAEHWSMARQELDASGRNPADWPYDLAFAAQWQMHTSRDRLALPLAAKIVMEAAIPMSKIDPRTVPGA